MDQKRLLVSLTLLLFPCGVASALDHVSFRRDDQPRQVSGRVLVELVDGGLLLEDRAGVLWAITAEELGSRQQDEIAFKPYSREEMGERLLSELPNGFRTHTTAHYVICYSTSQAYAEWCGALFEGLYRAFNNYWRKCGMPMRDPQQPLVALVFHNKGLYSQYGKAELGEAAGSTSGYFSLRTNRVTMYDLTGGDALRGGARISSASHINRILSFPEAERTVATIIHEATHQLAFNCGLQKRYADIPLWVSEGIAVYFETPDLSSKRGWRNIGGVNQVRLLELRRYLPRRPSDSLVTLLSSDDRFQPLGPDAYSEAWALNYFLIQKHRQNYVEYLKALAEKQPLIYDKPEERLELFKKFLGDDLGQLNIDFVRDMSSVH